MSLRSVGKGCGVALIRADSGANVLPCPHLPIDSFARKLFSKASRHQLIRLAVLFISLIFAARVTNAGEPSVTESQIKAAFLLNFAKYVEWPPESLDEAGPIVIAVFGDNEVSDDVQKLAENKIVGGRRIEFRRAQGPDDCANCHVLFIGTSEPRLISDILGRLADSSVLTVGECDEFLDKGGIINLARRDRKIRLDISLASARQARLKISSKLLTVADQVKGR